MVQHLPVKPGPRLVARLAIDCVLRVVRAITHHLDGDLLGGLVFLVLVQARYWQMSKAGVPAGEELRDGEGGLRPISINSLARSLKTPTETMRRCVVRLIDRGWCVRTGTKGVVVSDDVLRGPQMADFIAEIRASFWRMMADLRNLGFDFDHLGRANGEHAAASAELYVPAAETAFRKPPGDGSDSIIDRVIFDFVLRSIECGIIPHNNDYVRSCVFVAIMSANASPYAYNPHEAWRYATHDEPPPDSARRPVSVAELSQMLGLPYETLRRYVNALVGDGKCVRDARKGLLIPVDVLQLPELLQSGADTALRFGQMVGEFKRLGLDLATADFTALAGTP
jgi:hypothetical protein